MTLPDFVPKTWAQAAAFGRNAMSFVLGAVTLAAGWHVISAQDATQITGSINQIYAGITSIATGVTTIYGAIATLVTFGLAFYASHTANPKSQAASIVSAVPGTKIVTAPEIANAVPSPAVVSNTEMTVVSKASPVVTP